MRKLIVCNIVSLDGFYSGAGGDVMAMPFDVGFSDYNAERLRAADTLLLGCEPLQAFAEEVRQKVNEAGYDEIPVICELSAGVAMARAMVDMGVVQVARAYPSAGLKAIPECW